MVSYKFYCGASLCTHEHTRGYVGALRCVLPKLAPLVKRFRRTLRVLLPLEQPQTPRRIGRLLKQLRQKRIWG